MQGTPSVEGGETALSMEFSVWPEVEARAFAASPDPRQEASAILADEDADVGDLFRAAALCTMFGELEFAADLWADCIGRIREDGAEVAADGGSPRDLAPRLAATLRSSYFCLGEVYEHMGAIGSAFGVFRDGMQHTDDARCAMKFGLYSKDGGLYDQALEAYLLALDMDPDSGDPEFLLAELFEVMPDPPGESAPSGYYLLAASKGHSRASARTGLPPEVIEALQDRVGRRRASPGA